MGITRRSAIGRGGAPDVTATGSALRPGTLLHELTWIRIELGLAAFRAEVVRLASVLTAAGSLRRIDLHSADYVLFHLGISLNEVLDDVTQPVPSHYTGRRRRSGDLLSSPERTQLGLHLVNLGLLARENVLAQRSNLGVLYRGLLAHQNRARVMRNHRSQELSVGHRSLLSE